MIRKPGSSGRYPCPLWRVTLLIFKRDHRGGGQLLQERRQYEVRAKLAQTAMGRAVRFWKARGKARLGRATEISLHADRVRPR